MNVSKKDWLDRLEEGDEVIAKIPGETLATVDYVIRDSGSDSGYLIKLKNDVRVMDAFWINPASADSLKSILERKSKIDSHA